MDLSSFKEYKTSQVKLSLRHAYELATTSVDTSTQNAAIIYENLGIGDWFSIMPVAIGITRLPAYVEDRSIVEKRPEKYYYMDHAETVAVWNLVDWMIETKSHTKKTFTMVCPWFSCSDCAANIINCRLITRVIGHRTLLEKTHDRWKETMAHGHQKLIRAGIECGIYTGKVDAPPIRINYQNFNPNE